MQTERYEIKHMLETVKTTRKPCIRRSAEYDSLLATDLPVLTDAEGLKLFLQQTDEKGWTVKEKNGWLLLDRVPKRMTVVSSHGPEALACASIIERHSNRKPDAKLWREMMKACDERSDIEERAFARMHAALAECLRLHEPVPDIEIL